MLLSSIGTAVLAAAGAGIAIWANERRTARARRRDELDYASDVRFAAAAAVSPDALWEWDLRRGRVTYAPRWKELVGLRIIDVCDTPSEWFGRIHEEDRGQVEAELNAYFAGETPAFESVHRLVHADGSHRVVQCRALAVFDERGAAVRLTGVMVDATPRAVVEEPRTIAQDAMDAVTGLPFRALFSDVLSRAIARGKRRPDYLYAVVRVDLDTLPAVASMRGADAADELLALAARRLEACLRPTDVVARTGATEFTLLVDDMKAAEDLSIVANRVQQAFARPFGLASGDIEASAIIGLALGAPHYDEPRELLEDAARAVQAARTQGEPAGSHVTADADEVLVAVR